MGLDSYLEIFTTMFGWSIANTIVAMLFGTGLVWLPFLFMFFSTWVEAFEKGLDEGAVTWMVRKLEVQFYTGLFVFLTCFAASPLTDLSRVSLYFTPPATALNPSPQTATGASTGTTYDTAFSGTPQAAAVPAYWYTVMSLSSGMNSAVRAGVNGGMKDLRMIQDVANIATISNLALRDEIQGFYNECFIPARSRYLRTNPKSVESQAAIATYGDNDVDWMGSHAFRDDPALYPSMHSERRLVDFPFDPNGADADWDTSEPAPQGSRPTCADWWADPNVGLRFKMSEEIGKWGQLKQNIASVLTGMSNDETQDKLAQLALTKTRPNYISPEATMGDERSTWAKIAHAPQEVLGATGAAIEAFVAGAVMMPLITLMTMMQPLILMVIYMFLPLVVWFSGYDLRVLVYGAVGIFTVKFWSVMWFLARWMDDHLIEAMFPDRNLFFDFFVNAGDNNYKRMMLNVALFLLYIGMPAVWTGMMAWVGHRAAGGMAGLMDSAVGFAKSAGKKGVSVASTAISKGRR